MLKEDCSAFFLNCEGYCCFEAAEKGGIRDPRHLALLTLCRYECRM